MQAAVECRLLMQKDEGTDSGFRKFLGASKRLPAHEDSCVHTTVVWSFLYFHSTVNGV